MATFGRTTERTYTTAAEEGPNKDDDYESYEKRADKNYKFYEAILDTLDC